MQHSRKFANIIKDGIEHTGKMDEQLSLIDILIDILNDSENSPLDEPYGVTKARILAEGYRSLVYGEIDMIRGQFYELREFSKVTRSQKSDRIIEELSHEKKIALQSVKDCKAKEQSCQSTSDLACNWAMQRKYQGMAEAYEVAIELIKASEN